jgi:GntR family transcriptional regulator
MAVPAKTLAREPLYIQVCELLTRQIARGVWKPNAALPNELEFAKELGVSPGTIRKAMEKLEADRLVVRRQGRGTFVIDQTGPEIVARFDRMRRDDGAPIVWRVGLLQQSSGRPTEQEQRMLLVGPDDAVARKRRLLIASDRPFCVEETCLAVGRLTGLEDTDLGDWCITRLAQRHGVHVARASEEVRVAAASQEVATLLSVDPGTVLVQLDRIIPSTDAQPLEWRCAVCHLQEEYYHAEVH